MQRAKCWIAACGLVAGLGAGLSDGHALAGAQEVVVIAHPGVDAAEVAPTVLQDMFLGDRSRWEDQTKVTIAVLKRGEAHERFLVEVVRRTDSQFATHWKRLVFSGKGKMPKTFEEESELVAFVEKTEGAVGYVSEASALGSVKTIRVAP
jgi:ABC-type phosphate transport system substrate-binding protein